MFYAPSYAGYHSKTVMFNFVVNCLDFEVCGMIFIIRYIKFVM